jgi:hypothetical protein
MGVYTQPFSVENSGCTRLGVSINERKQRIAINNQTSNEIIRNNQEMINSTRSKQTTCNRIGSQTFCTTY